MFWCKSGVKPVSYAPLIARKPLGAKDFNFPAASSWGIVFEPTIRAQKLLKLGALTGIKNFLTYNFLQVFIVSTSTGVKTGVNQIRLY